MILAAAALFMPISGVSVALAGSAAAATPGVACSRLAGSTSTTNVTISRCSDRKNTGGKGTIPTSSLESGSGTITWNGTGTTKVTAVTVAAVSPNACPTGSTELEVQGTIAGGKGQAAKSIKKGWSVQAFVCLKASNGALSLTPGTMLHIGAAY
jgi:hypothetical protein